MPRLTIRAEMPGDHPIVAEVTTQAFGKEREARIIESIRASDGYVPELSLVAELAGRVVGHVMVSYVGLDGSERRLPELGPISVAPRAPARGNRLRARPRGATARR